MKTLETAISISHGQVIAMKKRISVLAIVVLAIAAFATKAQRADASDSFMNTFGSVFSNMVHPAAFFQDEEAEDVPATDIFPSQGTDCPTSFEPSTGYISDPNDAYPSSAPSWLAGWVQSGAPVQCGWDINAGSIYMTRRQPKNEMVLSGGSTGESLTYQDLNFQWAAGPWVSASKTLDGCGLWSANVVYFGIDGWQFQRDVPNALDIGQARLNVGNNGYINADYTSKLYNVEVNLERNFGTCFRAFAGYRWMEISDDMVLTGDSIVTSKTLNQYNGFQIGVTGRNLLPWWTKVNCATTLKAGVFDNRASMNQHTVQGTDIGSTRDHTAFIGDLSVDLTYCCTDHLVIFGGYEMLWVDSVALAPNQLDILTSSTVDIDDTALYHGARLGFNVNW